MLTSLSKSVITCILLSQAHPQDDDDIFIVMVVGLVPSQFQYFFLHVISKN